MSRMDIVTVFHNEENYRLHLQLTDAIARHEAKGGWRMVGVDNRQQNRGFSAGCNLGAFDERADSPVIGFVNPDCIVTAPFMDQVMEVIRRRRVVITGSSFNKNPEEIKAWGVRRWVCGAAFFVRRDWFTQVGGFDERFVWGWEETDLCRLAESQGHLVQPIGLPIEHASPTENSPEDAIYKNRHFEAGARLYREKWARHGR